MEENLQETSLKRDVGLFSSANVLIGIMVGSGIFYLGSYVLIRCGMSLGLALLVWIIGGLVTLISGLCYAELGAMMPKAGGVYIYLKEAYGKALSFVGGTSSFILGSCGSTAAIAIAFSASLATIIDLSSIQMKLIAVFFVVLLTIVNIRGVKQGSIVQNIFTIGKLLPIGVILIAGLLLGKESPDLTKLPITEDGFNFFTIFGMVGFATVATLWAYEGWTNLNVISEEIKNPKKNIPKAITVSIVFVMALYAIFNFAIYKVVPYETIVNLINAEEYYLGTEAAKILFGNYGGYAVSACMIIAIFGSLNGCILVFPRTALAIARDGMLPKKIAEIHPKYNTPCNALILHMIISIILIFMRNLSQMTSLVTFSAMIFNTLTFYAIIRLRKTQPDLERPYKVKTPIIYITIIIMIALMINTLREDIVTSLIGLSVPLVCFIAYLIIEKRKKIGEVNENNNL